MVMPASDRSKRVVLRFQAGRFETGFSVALQVGEAIATGQSLRYESMAEVSGSLPPALDLLTAYTTWQTAYRRTRGNFRLGKPPDQTPNFSQEDCPNAAKHLSDRLNQWLRSEGFLPLREKWLEQLTPNDRIQVLIQSDHPQVQRLPWNLWDLVDRYPGAEVCLSLHRFERVEPPKPKPQLDILAVFGSRTGLDLDRDEAVLNNLPRARVTRLVEPSRLELNDLLWSRPWDILFFAGHSDTLEDGTGRLYLNPEDEEGLSLEDIRHALRRLVNRGLALAIFNSCNGLGLMRALGDVQVPQLIVMREPVADPVAQRFLEGLLGRFAQGQPLYQAVREAREQLQGMEDRFPCASWVPLLCQNPAAVPLCWPGEGVRPGESERWPWRRAVLSGLASTVAIALVRGAGLLQGVELASFDQLMRSRPQETPDPRLLIVGVTEEDLSQMETGRGSVSDPALGKALQVLLAAQPRLIGVDFYRPFAAEDPQLKEILSRDTPIIGVCKTSDPNRNIIGIAPPPELPPEHSGYSDFWADPDRVLRRQVFSITPHPASPCQASYALSSILALGYLALEQPPLTATVDAEGMLQVGSLQIPRLSSHSGGYQRLDAGGYQLLLNYRNTREVADTVTLGQVLRQQVAAAQIRDRIVLIGSVAASKNDTWVTSLGGRSGQEVPGVMVQAHMVSQILSAVTQERSLLWVWPIWGDVLWLLGWSLGAALLGARWRSPQVLLLSGLGLGLGLYTLAWLALVVWALWVPLIPPLLGMGLGAIGTQNWRKTGA